MGLWLLGPHPGNPRNSKKIKDLLDERYINISSQKTKRLLLKRKKGEPTANKPMKGLSRLGYVKIKIYSLLNKLSVCGFSCHLRSMHEQWINSSRRTY